MDMHEAIFHLRQAGEVRLVNATIEEVKQLIEELESETSDSYKYEIDGELTTIETFCGCNIKIIK